MKIRVEYGLAYVEVVLTFRGRSLCLGDTILDTGSASTIFSADRLLESGPVPSSTSGASTFISRSRVRANASMLG